MIDTNTVVAVTNTVVNPDVSQAIQTIIHAAVPSLTTTDITTLVGAVVIIARILRKVIPDNAQLGKAGTFLKHLALEINPQLTPPPPDKVVTTTTAYVGKAQP
jgi:hypothetical protein